MFGRGDEVYWTRIGDAMEASHCLSSLHIHLDKGSLPHELSAVLTGLCRMERLTELTIVAKHGLEGRYVLSL